MKPILTPLHLSFLILFLFITLSHSQPYTPVDNITLACGSSGHLTSFNNLRTWTGDVNSKFTPTSNSSSSSSTSLPSPPSTETNPPYTSARLSFAPFTYTIPVSPGKKFIRLHFNPTTYSPTFQLSNSLFSVATDNFTLLHDFNASAVNHPLVKEYCFNVENGRQRLTLTFTPSNEKAYAFVNGIEVVSMPDDLYYTNSPKFVDATSARVYPIENDTALEMVYRINVGGRSIPPDEDTGMYRNWDFDDASYLDEDSKKNSVLPQNNTIELKFVTIREYVAPKNIYMTGNYSSYP